jgi:hypothetical protein
MDEKLAEQVLSEDATNEVLDGENTAEDRPDDRENVIYILPAAYNA